MNLLILGAGFSGRAIGQLASTNGATVAGTTRSAENAQSLRNHNIEPLVFDATDLEPMRSALEKATHLIVSIAPPRREGPNGENGIVDPFLRMLDGQSLRELAPNLQWIGYLSTVGVYGNHDGAWVDEETPVAPSSERSRQRMRAEAEWLAAGKAMAVPIGIFRLSGIYGPGRNAFVTIKNGKSRRLVKKDQVFNRIHVGDIAQALWHAASQNAGGIFNITDHEPAPPQDVVTYAHDLMGLEPPPEIDFETADLTPMARSFYGENKRVSNAKSRAVLGLKYHWPDYRTSFEKMWRDGSWQA